MGHLLLRRRGGETATLGAALPALAGAVVSMVGCGSPQPPTPVAAVPRAVSSVILRTPGYESDGRTLVRARERLIARCMAAQGFEYHPAPVPPPAPPVTPPRPDVGYGELATAAAVDPSTLRWALRPSTAPQARYLRRLPTRRRAAYHRALDGSPHDVASFQVPGGPRVSYETGGCYTRSTGRLYGSVRDYQSLIATQNVVGIAFAQRVSQDRRLVRAVDEWRRCMSDRGFRYQSPDQARDVIYGAYLRARHPASVRARELATARADGACGQASGIYAQRSRAESAGLRSLPPSAMRSMAKLARFRSTAVVRARDVLAAAR